MDTGGQWTSFKTDEGNICSNTSLSVSSKIECCLPNKPCKEWLSMQNYTEMSAILRLWTPFEASNTNKCNEASILSCFICSICSERWCLSLLDSIWIGCAFRYRQFWIHILAQNIWILCNYSDIGRMFHHIRLRRKLCALLREEKKKTNFKI